MNIYCLHSKKRNCDMSFHFSSNGEGEFCNDVSCELDAAVGKEANLWLHKNKEVADKAAATNPKWYNSGYETPMWNKEYYGELEVVRVEE